MDKPIVPKSFCVYNLYNMSSKENDMFNENKQEVAEELLELGEGKNMPEVVIGKEIAKALFKFQSEVPDIKKESENPFYKSSYAALEDILPAIKSALKSCDLGFVQIPIGKNQLRTIIFHVTSGESFEGTIEFTPTKTDPQGQGSGITYMRRYALVSMLGLNVANDDDDGNASVKNIPQKQTPTSPKKPLGPSNAKEARTLAEKTIKESKTVEDLEKTSKRVAESKLLTAEDKEELFVLIVDRKEAIEFAVFESEQPKEEPNVSN